MVASQMLTEFRERRYSENIAQLPVVRLFKDVVQRLPIQQELVLDRADEAIIGQLCEVAANEVSVDRRSRALSSPS